MAAEPLRCPWCGHEVKTNADGLNWLLGSQRVERLRAVTVAAKRAVDNAGGDHTYPGDGEDETWWYTVMPSDWDPLHDAIDALHAGDLGDDQ